jgi:hypothetical protein
MLESGILYQAMITEFEMTVYRNPDMTVSEMNRLYADLERDYALGFDFIMGDETEYVEAYGWVDIMHRFHSPLYCVSYVTSGLSSLSLYTWAQEDRQAAIGGYLDLIALPGDVGYKEAVAGSGLDDIFEPGTVDDILANVMSYVFAEEEEKEAGHEESGEGYEERGVEDEGESKEEGDQNEGRFLDQYITDLIERAKQPGGGGEAERVFLIVSVATIACGAVMSVIGIVTGIIVLFKKR